MRNTINITKMANHPLRSLIWRWWEQKPCPWVSRTFAATKTRCSTAEWVHHRQLPALNGSCSRSWATAVAPYERVEVYHSKLWNTSRFCSTTIFPPLTQIPSIWMLDSTASWRAMDISRSFKLFERLRVEFEYRNHSNYVNDWDRNR